jgi:hypothetical protein
LDFVDVRVASWQEGEMAQANTQQTSSECPRCGKTFSSVQELLEHEKNCKPSGKAAEGAKKKEQTATDMVIEDRFEAIDN